MLLKKYNYTKYSILIFQPQSILLGFFIIFLLWHYHFIINIVYFINISITPIVLNLGFLYFKQFLRKNDNSYQFQVTLLFIHGNKIVFKKFLLCTSYHPERCLVLFKEFGGQSFTAPHGRMGYGVRIYSIIQINT